MDCVLRPVSHGWNCEAVLVYTIGLNGYIDRYDDYVRSQQEYAKRNGYAYLVVTEPSWKYGASEASWLKIAVMNDALADGYDRVAYIDCDAEVLPFAPPIDSVFGIDSRGDVFMARGHSGRFNAGVIFVRNSLLSRRFFEAIWNNIGTPLDPADDVGWGENSHVIQAARRMGCVTEMPSSWNNTAWPPSRSEFIRHHTGQLQNAEENQTAQAGTIVGPSVRSKPTADRLTTRPEDSALLIQRTHLLAAEYSPRVPIPQRR